MTTAQKLIPQPAIKGIGSGLCLMAFFTLMWAGIALSGFKNYATQAILMCLYVFVIIYFIAIAIRIFRRARYFPKLTSADDIAEEKRMGKWFGIIFGAEGLGIFIGINIVNNLGHPELIIQTIALVVGLHFFPLAKVFKRTIDYYLATWATLVAIAGFVLSLKGILPQNTVTIIVGLGISVATVAYGIYMVGAGQSALNAQRLVNQES